MAFQKYSLPTRKNSNVTHYVLVRKRTESGDKSETRSFPISSDKSTEQIRDEIKTMITNIRSSVAMKPLKR